jgi:hypothetical protein
MLHALKLHPDSVCEAVGRIDVWLTRQAAHLALRVIVHGNIAALRIPSVIAGRADRLWEHTCCEAFIQAADDAYFELNLSPSTQWAAYRFNGYRQGMTNAQVAAPAITVAADAAQFELHARIDCTQLSLGNEKWCAGLSVVIEEASGRKSYWALAHGPGKPDFHHADGFVLELEP